MQKAPPAADPEAYVEALTGWQRPLVEGIRATAQEHAARVIRGTLERSGFAVRRGRRVLFSRGSRCATSTPDGGQYEMATVELREVTGSATVRWLGKLMRLNWPRATDPFEALRASVGNPGPRYMPPTRT
jgi:hypothetical protein